LPGSPKKVLHFSVPFAGSTYATFQLYFSKYMKITEKSKKKGDEVNHSP